MCALCYCPICCHRYKVRFAIFLRSKNNNTFSKFRLKIISELAKTIKKLPKAIDKATQAAVIRRIDSVSQSLSSLPIPKGIDPTKVRGQRPR